MRKTAFLVVLALTLSSSIMASAVTAQTGLGGVANNIEIDDPEAGPGDILAATETGIRRSSTPYDREMFGVIVEFPVLSSGQITDSTVSVMSSGRAVVKVSAAANGPINEGDFITSSSTPGVGQKATQSGFVLGKAISGYSDTTQDGEIPVFINIGIYSTTSNIGGALSTLAETLNLGFQNTQNFPIILRYLLAAIIVLVTFLTSAFTFVRFMRNGIEAIGRNPLAKRTIISGMILNAVIVGLMTIAGFGVAVAIVVL